MIGIRLLFAIIILLHNIFRLLGKLLYYWAKVAIFLGVFGLLVNLLMGDNLDTAIITITLGILLPGMNLLMMMTTKYIIQKLDRYLTKPNQSDVEDRCEGDM
ncbi:MAG: hypothetical protein PHI41_10105 [Erysipelotrichaceae bacterium]|nr:hypothetical protein [Erysipelotrichaceae bacterium]